MRAIPISEKIKFEALVSGHASRYGMPPEEYLRKVWYHEEASRIGEFMAISLLNELLAMTPQAVDARADATDG